MKRLYATTKHGNPLNRLTTDISLFWKSPREFLYLFTYPTDQKIQIAAFDPNVATLGNSYVETLRGAVPNLKVHFFGSAALGLPGQRDIDLFIVCNPKQFDQYIPLLNNIFGTFQKRRPKFVQWHFVKDTCTIDASLIDPSSHLYKETLRSFDILKNNKKRRNEYVALKRSSDGLSMRQYHKKRLAFFNSL